MALQIPIQNDLYENLTNWMSMRRRAVLGGCDFDGILCCFVLLECEGKDKLPIMNKRKLGSNKGLRIPDGKV